jgi:pyruvate dehydrogenase E1 component alpha subunit
MKYRGEKDSAAVAYCGDGATSQGDFHEALNFAAVWKAPAVFIVQNNQWAISIPRNKQTISETLAQKAIAYNMPGVQVDGNDALAVYRATREALDRAHAGEGPTLIEAETYRLMMHTTADDPKKYRSEDDVKEWWEKEPLRRFKIYLENKGIWDDDKQSSMEREIKEEIEAAVKEYESRSGFKPDAPFDYVFGTDHDVIEGQRAEFLDNLEKEAGDA